MAFFAQYDGTCAAGCGRIHPGDLVVRDVVTGRLVHVMCDNPTGEVEDEMGWPDA